MFPDAPRTVTFTFDGRSLLSASRDGEFRVWNAITGKLLGAPFVQDSALSALGVDFRSENEQLRESISLSIETKNVIYSLQLPQTSRLSEFVRWTEGVSGLHFAADGQLTSISSEERLLRLYTPLVDAHDESKWAKLIRWVQMNPKSDQSLHERRAAQQARYHLHLVASRCREERRRILTGMRNAASPASDAAG